MNNIEILNKLLDKIDEVVEDFKRELTEQFKEEEQEEEKTIYNLQEKDKYWVIYDDGATVFTQWGYDEFDKERLEIGNVFLTEQEALDEVRRRKLIAKAKASKGNLTPTRNDLVDNIEMYQVGYRMSKGFIKVNICGATTGVALGVWETEEDVQKFINENEEELYWFFTGEELNK